MSTLVKFHLCSDVLNECHLADFTEMHIIGTAVLATCRTVPVWVMGFAWEAARACREIVFEWYVRRQ